MAIHIQRRELLVTLGGAATWPRGADALLVHVDALFNDRGEYQIADLAAQYRLPTMMANDTFPGRGGLISYGGDTHDLNRQAGVYIGVRYFVRFRDKADKA